MPSFDPDPASNWSNWLSVWTASTKPYVFLFVVFYLFRRTLLPRRAHTDFKPSEDKAKDILSPQLLQFVLSHFEWLVLSPFYVGLCLIYFWPLCYDDWLPFYFYSQITHHLWDVNVGRTYSGLFDVQRYPPGTQKTPQMVVREWDWDEVVAVGLCYAGYTLRQWSFDTLGRFFTYMVTIKKDHQLITEGPFRYLVHPSYTGLGMVIYSTFYFTGLRSIMDFILFLAVFGFLVRTRVRNEEAALKEQFGSAFDEYMRHRYRFIPGVF